MNLIGSSLSCKRDGKLIFSDLSFKIKSGDVCFIKGPNGSGKSTLLRLLAGFIKVWTGKISLNNEDITNRNDIIYNNFFYIGHSNSLKNYLTVKQQIDFWEGISEKKYNFEADSFNLKRILNRRIYECSEGQKRRVGLSRLSIDNKKVLLLDEPITSLDIENVSRLKNYLKDHQKKGGIAIVASHEAFISSNNQDIILTLNPPKNRERDPFI
jgi:heme exporter protein A